MPAAGDTISNPATGEVLTFVATAAETGGELLVVETRWARPGERAAPHRHPGMEERFELLAGSATVRAGSEEHELAIGEPFAVSPGIAHAAWNAGQDEARLRLEFRPALRWAEVVDRLFALARDGRTDARGVPEPALIGALLAEYPEELAPG